MFENWSDEQFTIWLAGFFDGEGCIYIPAESGIAVSVSNTNREVIFAIFSRLGMGRITEVKHSNANWRTKYTWEVKRCDQAEVFIQMVRPFLCLKAAKADEAMKRVGGVKAKRLAMNERNRKIIELVQSGMKHRDIAERLGMNRNTVTMICRAHRRGGWGNKATLPFVSYSEGYAKKPVQVTTSCEVKVSSIKPIDKVL